MHFKATMVLSNMAVDEGQTLEFTLKEPNPLRMTVRRATAEEVRDKDDYFGPPNWCEVYTEEAVSEKVTAHFESATKIEKEFKPDMVNFGVAPKAPQSVLEIADRVYDRMHAFVLRTANLVTWRVGVHTSGKTIHRVRSLSWSDDGTEWETIPGVTDMELIKSILIWPPDFGGFTDIDKLLQHRLYEPVGHQLLREAFLIKDSSPRSALLIGMSAAEVGVKELIGRLVPKAEWLAMHVPTPPLIQMLTQYLPLLPVRGRFGSPAVTPFIPKNILEHLTKGVRLRNEATHQGQDIKTETLKAVLAAVQDLLWILDSYAGFPWVINRIIGETAQAIDEHIKKEHAKKP